ncbi:PEGA domain-containing protein [Myxococcota bacterium]|nr:PEGA domain-containing protein [Myxococcota bacterium]MBU1430386.1 PEGA domain-containing protein [Myxococcota bacterium]MBU1897690.1 PEGA domain-containing protein [Myxococcota bacterium]
MRWLAPLCLCAALIGCGDGVIQRIDDPRDPLASPAPGRRLRIEATPPDVDIYIDGVYHGRLDGYRQGTLPIPAAARRIQLSKPGFEGWYALIPAGERVQLSAALIPKVP